MFSILTKKNLKLGNSDAFKGVFQVLYPRLKSYSKLFIKDEDQVEDIIQESFITLWKKRNSIKIKESIESYIFVIVRNRCLNFLKKNKNNISSIDVDRLNIEESQYLYQLDFMGKEDKSLEELLMGSLLDAINDLPDKMKEVFIKCKIEGRKQKDVAEELGISLKMIEKHILKSKQKIRKALIEHHPEI